MRFKIIKLNRRHINQIAEVDLESEHELDKKNKRNLSSYITEINKRFNKRHELFFGIKTGKELVGYVTLKPFFPGYKHCEVYWLAIKRKYQRKGIGTKLMIFIETFARKKGFRKICLYTNKTNKKARKFYEKLGYKLINEFPDYYGYTKGCKTAVLYCKNLR